MSLLILYVLVSTSKAAGSLHARGDGLQQCPRAQSSASCGKQMPLAYMGVCYAVHLELSFVTM